MAEPEPIRLFVGDTAPDHARTVTELAAALRVSEARVRALEAQQPQVVDINPLVAPMEKLRQRRDRRFRCGAGRHDGARTVRDARRR